MPELPGRWHGRSWFVPLWHKIPGFDTTAGFFAGNIVPYPMVLIRIPTSHPRNDLAIFRVSTNAVNEKDC